MQGISVGPEAPRAVFRSLANTLRADDPLRLRFKSDQVDAKLLIMPLSSPVRARSAIDQSATDARVQAQIVELETQRADLVRRHLDAAASPGPTLAQSMQTGSAESPDNGKEMCDLAEQQISDTVAFAEARVKKHIELLHDYNEIKDVASGLMALIAEQRGVRLVDVLSEFGAADTD